MHFRPFLFFASCLLASLLLSSCGLLTNLPTGDDILSGFSNEPVYEPTATYKITMGGVAPGRDELILFDANGSPRGFLREGYKTLTFEAEPNIVEFSPRDGFNSPIAGSGAKLTPQKVGIATVFHYLDGVKQSDTFQVIIPPQKLVQILVAEAKTEILKEVKLNGEGAVDLGNRSLTAEALGHVINSRIAFITEHGPSLFNADAKTYESNPPQSYYDAVIEAKNQFNPTIPGDASNETYRNAALRTDLTDSILPAYDQAVLTAAAIFCGTTCKVTDTTNGAFAFRSPNEDQWEIVKSALTSATTKLPSGIGFSDQTFPSLNPIQILVHPDVRKYDDGRATFIFARQRLSTDPAVTNQP